MAAAQELADLEARRAEVTANIAALKTGSPKLDLPNSTGPGVNVDYEKYKAGLYKELREIDEAIERVDPDAGSFLPAGVVIP